MKERMNTNEKEGREDYPTSAMYRQEDSTFAMFVAEVVFPFFFHHFCMFFRPYLVCFCTFSGTSPYLKGAFTKAFSL